MSNIRWYLANHAFLGAASTPLTFFFREHFRVFH